MSTDDFHALRGEWVGRGVEHDFRRWSQDLVTQTLARLEGAKEVRERMLFSAWLNTLREEWEAWCRYHEGRGKC